MSVFQAKKGESKECTVFQDVLALWWNRQRVHPGETVELGAFLAGVKDGVSVTLELYAGTDSTPLEKLDATVSGGKAKASWKVQLPERPDWGEVVPVAFDAVAGRLRSARTKRVVLDVDAGLPPFSL